MSRAAASRSLIRGVSWDEVAADIVDSLQTARDRFRGVAKALGGAP